MEDKQFTFCCDPKYVKALNEMGVDIVSLANNHTLDYGRDALSDTFTTLDGAGILYAGAGETKNAHMNCRLSRKMEKIRISSGIPRGAGIKLESGRADTGNADRL